MALSDSVILKELEVGNIVINPFVRENLGPASYDMTLGDRCKMYEISLKPDTYPYLDVKHSNPVIEYEISKSGVVLRPNHLYLYSCVETLGLKGIAATIMGKSSLGRLGLDIHVCAGFADPGFEGSLVLEMRTIYPLKIYPGMKICQVKFERVEGEILEPYDKKPGSKYQGQQGVVESRYYKNFE